MKNPKRSYTAALLTGLLACGLLCEQAHANTIFESTAGALGANDSILWGQFGAAFTGVSSPSTAVSQNLLTATVTTSNTTNMERRDQNTGGWAGNFTSGDQLLWNQGNLGDITVNFSTSISGAGANFQADFFGSFVGNISAYDSLWNQLGSFDFTGNSNSNNDGSAVFAGIYDSTGSISHIVFTDKSTPNDFAINSLLLNTSGNQRVPDATATLPLLGLALAGLGLLRRKFGSV